MKTTRPEPFSRDDDKGEWRLQVVSGIRNNRKILCNGSWDTKEQAEDWVRWNNFDEGLYGEIVRNPLLTESGEVTK